MRVVFFGIYQIGVDALSALVGAGIDVACVITKPDDAAGRQPVAEVASRAGLVLEQPETPRDPALIGRIADYQPDLILVAGYHRIIPQQVLDIPRLGVLNLHGSLLPRYRGPCSWKWTIMNGETTTGVSVHVMMPELDTGDILAQREVPVGEEDTGEELFRKLSAAGGSLLADTVRRMGEGTVERIPQDESLATYFGYPSEEVCRIDWSAPTQRIHDLVRGLNRRPGAWTRFAGTQLRVLASQRSPEPATAEPPGTVLSVSPDGIAVRSGDGVLVIRELVLEDQPSSSTPEIAASLGIAPGQRFETVPAS